MRISSLFLLLSLLSPLVCSLSAPFCGQWDTQTAGEYILYNNLWGMNGATGKQCTSLISLDSSVISWNTTYTWSGGSGVKSFANANLNAGLNKQLSAISSIKSTWQWSYDIDGNIEADVAYDIFTSATSQGANAYEIMIWLAKYGDVEPISAHYNASGLPVPIVSPTISGVQYHLYEGTVSTWTVYSFVAEKTITSYSGDVKEFLSYLVNSKYVSNSQYLKTFQAGTEPTSGKATLVSKFSAVVA